MPIFNYKARNKIGRIKRGRAIANNESLAIKALNKRGLEVLWIKDATKSIDHKFIFLFNPIKSVDLVVFSRQFSVMMAAGVPISDALITIVNQTDNLKFRNILSKVAYDVDNGEFLSVALKKHPRTFSNFFTNVVKAGESSGRLDEVLSYLADEIEKDYDLSKSFKNSLIYPLFVIIGLIVVGFVFMFFVLPELTRILAETGGTLPLATRIVIATINFLKTYFIVILFFIALFVMFSQVFFKTSVGRKSRDLFLLKIPVVGKILQRIYVVRFSRSLALLLKGGVPTHQALAIVLDIIKNEVYKDLIRRTIDNVNEGGSIVDVLETSDMVPKMLPQMMAVGESTARLDHTLVETANFYDKEVLTKLSNLGTILEPIIMIIMGIGVGIMVAAIILPMYNLAGQI
ncbi:MAG: type II secretion system F family protein [Patescibacteria group bacterium]|jgi:type II secretory pathway component PulF|nr:type II secretion system F family protein [Patescibacteria group bacterium]